MRPSLDCRRNNFRTLHRLPDAEIGHEGHKAYYDKSWALVIGINEYEGRPLKNARNDAEKFAALLKEKYGFEEVISLLDKDASRENILRYLWEDLKDRVGAEDRLIIFFAGHGESQPSKDGGRIGYIIPQDARKGTFIDHIKMNELREACDIIPAKHILIILDCCFSGVAAIATCLRGETDEKPPKKLNDAYLRKLTEKKAYQIMTAGDVDQSTPDSSLTPGHSAFTAALLNGLRGDADSDGNGLITATELYDYIQPRVLSETSKDGAEGQMPFLDYIKGSDIYHPGNFVFLLSDVTVIQGDKGNKDNGYNDITIGRVEEESHIPFGKLAAFVVGILFIFASGFYVFQASIPGEDRFYGTYTMNHDGWPGILTLGHNPAYDSVGGKYNINGTYASQIVYQILGSTWRTKKNHYGILLKESNQMWQGEKYDNIINFSFGNGDKTQGLQEFTGYLFDNNKAMAGVTSWHGRPFGFYAIKDNETMDLKGPIIDPVFDVSENASAESKFYGIYTINSNGSIGMLFLQHNPSYDYGGGKYNLEGTYTVIDGREFDVLGSTLETTRGSNYYWSDDKFGNIIKFDVDFGDVTQGHQEFTGYMFSNNEAMAGKTAYHDRPLGFYAIKKY